MQPKEERTFDYGSAAVGAIIAVGTIVAILAGFSIDPWARDAFCLQGETATVCGRNWFSVIAVIAGALTILFLAIGQRSETKRRIDDERWRRELAVLENYGIRTTIQKASAIAEQIALSAQTVRKARERAQNVERQPAIAASTIFAMRRIYNRLIDPVVDQYRSIDHKSEWLIRSAKTTLEMVLQDYDKDFETDRMQDLTSRPVLYSEVAEDFFSSSLLDMLAVELRQITDRIKDVEAHMREFRLGEVL
tara:strand:+ start:95 stop:841 length:747 start_codon:yes stop_codon:yes gene_type:complete